MKKLAEKIIQNKITITVITTIITIILGYQIKNIEINSDFIKSLPDDDPLAVQYKYIGEKYKGADMGMIIMETENIYNYEVLKHIRQITDSLKVINGVSTVTSLTDVLDIKSD